MRFQWWTLSALPLSIALAGGAPAALAQEADAVVAEGGGFDIIVTARKRDESLLDVPVVVSAISGAALEERKINDIYTLSSEVTGLSMGFQSGVLGPQISIRGIGTTASNATIDQSVSLNVDGLQLTQGFSYEAAMFDVAQIEVMKGPQALFFGKNSPAGVISMRTADPTDRFEAILRTAYEAEGEEKLMEAVISGPVSSSLKLRLAAHYSDDNGFFRNLATAPAGYGVRTPTTRNFATTEDLILRGTAVFAPGGDYDARLKVNHTEKFINHGGGDTQIASCPGGNLVSFTGLPVFDPAEDCTLNRNTYISWMDPAAFPFLGNGGIPFTDSRSWFGSLEQNLRFGDLTLTSLSGYYNYRQLAMGNGAEVSGVTPLAPRNSFSHELFTQELRLLSDFKGPLNFMIGGFVEDAWMRNHVRIYGNTAIMVPAVLQDVIHTIDIFSLSGFGQVIWSIGDRLELTAGARVTHEKRKHSQENVATLGVPPGPAPLLHPRISDTNVSPEISLTWRPHANLTAFASYRQGFKSGSFNTVVFADPATDASFNDETVRGGEVGLKAIAESGQLVLNAAAYYYHYKGLQVGASEVTPTGGIAFRTLNAASANVKGVEFDAAYRPAAMQGLTLRAGANYNDARYDKFPNAPCGNNQTIAGGCDQLFSPVTGTYNAQDLAGVPLVRAPKWVFNAGFDYDLPVGDGMTFGMGAGANYSSSFSQSVVNLPGFRQHQYAKVDARLRLSGADDGWELALIGKNLTNKITAAACFNANLNGAVIFGGQVSGAPAGGPAGDDYKVCAPERGRAVWLQLTLRPHQWR